MCSQHSIKPGVLITLLARPVTKKCYDRYPRELRLRLKKYHENEAARDQGSNQ